MKIANKINLSFLGAVTFFLAIATAGAFSFSRKEIEKQIDNHLETIVLSQAQSIRTYLFMSKMAVIQFSKDLTVIDFLKIRARGSLETEFFFDLVIKRLARTEEVKPAVLEFLILDCAGRVIASSNEKSLGEDKSKSDLFLEGRENVYIKDAYFSPDYQKPIIDISAPIVNQETKQLLGLLAARIDLNTLYKIVTDRTGLGKTGEVYIVNKDGYMISPSRFIEDTFLRKKIDTAGFRDILEHRERGKIQKEREEILIAPNYRGVQALNANDFIKEMQWSVLAEIETQEAYEPLKKIGFLFLVGFFVIIFALAFVGKTISRVITGPIHQLHHGTEVIGSGDLNYKVGTDEKDEIGQLSRAFDQMTQNLKHTTTSIKKLNQEIAERKKLEEALKLADERKSAFVRDVSHEFRNPLTTARATMSMILRGDAGPLDEKQRTLLELTKNSIDRLIRLVMDILDLSKIEAGKMEIKREEIEILSLVEEILRTYEIDMGRKKQKLQKDIPSDIGLLWADRDKITGVIINLLGNAIKYTPDEGLIGVKVAGDDKNVRFEIWDTGPGLLPEDLGRLFSKFERITAERKEGTGLGLVITKEIVELHRGKIWVESEAGRGTKFAFVLPRDSKSSSFEG